MTQQNTLLIIDDEISIRESLKLYFEDKGYLVYTASDGQEGLNIFFKIPVDMVITDLRMPKKDGLEVMKTIFQTRPDIPMIVISGAGRKKDIIKALRMGAKDYITKPIDDLDRISHTVRQALENYRLNKENKQYREKIEKSENQYRTITENIAEGVFTVDDFENFTYANQAFSTMTGFSNTEILKKNLKDIATKDSFNIIRQQTQIRKKGKTGRYEIRLIDKNQKKVHVEFACSPLWDNKNQYQGSIAVVRDITRIIELKKQFQKYIHQKDYPSKDVLPICANCKSIKIKEDDWIPVEAYFSDIVFSHGICPACCDQLYPEFDFSDLIR